MSSRLWHGWRFRLSRDCPSAWLQTSYQSIHVSRGAGCLWSWKCAPYSLDSALPWSFCTGLARSSGHSPPSTHSSASGSRTNRCHCVTYSRTRVYSSLFGCLCSPHVGSSGTCTGRKSTQFWRKDRRADISSTFYAPSLRSCTFIEQLSSADSIYLEPSHSKFLFLICHPVVWHGLSPVRASFPLLSPKVTTSSKEIDYRCLYLELERHAWELSAGSVRAIASQDLEL